MYIRREKTSGFFIKKLTDFYVFWRWPWQNKPAIFVNSIHRRPPPSFGSRHIILVFFINDLKRGLEWGVSSVMFLNVYGQNWFILTANRQKSYIWKITAAYNVLSLTVMFTLVDHEVKFVTRRLHETTIAETFRNSDNVFSKYGSFLETAQATFKIK